MNVGSLIEEDRVKMTLPKVIPADQPSSHHKYPQWVNGKGNRRVDLPIRLTGMAVTLFRKAPYLDRMEPVADRAIRLQGLCAVYGREAAKKEVRTASK